MTPAGDVVKAAITAFANRDLTLHDLRRAFTPLLAAGQVGPDSGAEGFLTDLVFLFEDDSLSEQQHQQNAQRIVHLLRPEFNNTLTQKLLRVVLSQDRLCDVIGKVKAGIISRTKFVAFIGALRVSDDVKTYLTDASPERLEQLCATLALSDTAALAALLNIER